MATATASSTSSTAAASGQGADDNYATSGQPGEATTAGGPTGDPNSTGSQGGSAANSGDSSGTAASEGGASPLDDSRLSEPLRAERRKSNQLEKEIRTLRQQLNRFSEINPEEYARLQEAERQKQILEQQMELRERQMEEASAQKVAAVAAERHRDVLARQLADAVGGDRRAVGVGLVVEARERVDQIEVVAAHHLQAVIGLVAIGHHLGKLGFVVLRVVKADGTRAHRSV